jgi:hypothetical protein
VPQGHRPAPGRAGQGQGLTVRPRQPPPGRRGGPAR